MVCVWSRHDTHLQDKFTADQIWGILVNIRFTRLLSSHPTPKRRTSKKKEHSRRLWYYCLTTLRSIHGAWNRNSHYCGNTSLAAQRTFHNCLCLRRGPRQLRRYDYFLRAGRSGDRTSVGRDILHMSRQALDPPILLYNENRAYFPEVKLPGAWCLSRTPI